jgi:hypothetical protein
MIIYNKMPPKGNDVAWRSTTHFFTALYKI